MVHCANPIVREYMHGGDNELEELCPPQVDFQIDADNLGLYSALNLPSESKSEYN